jgi:hypothetical protein
MPGAADYAIKVFGEPDNQVAGVNGAIKMNPVMSGGKKKNKNNKSHKNKKSHKNNKFRGGKNKKNKSQKKVMRGGK